MIKIKSTKTFINEDAGVIVFKIYDALGREFIGKSKCSKEDKFDKDFGEKLAYLRAKRKFAQHYAKVERRLLNTATETYERVKEKLDKNITKYNVMDENISKTILKMLSD